MSADAKAPGAESDAEVGLTPDRALEGFYEALRSVHGMDQRFIVGREILVKLLSGSHDRLHDFARIVEHQLETINRDHSAWMTPPIRALPKIFSVREVRANFADVLDQALVRDVTIVRNSRPTAVLLSYERYENLIDQIEDLQDQLSIATREHDTISMEEAFDGLED
ncbi:type II toxin-antitoxin system Phd/YefM family antitoxin [Nocardia fusca]|uniref:type II toxin-antitoxin system Phd/YefM family antitoxin n=1 Tax=Nocardia fusca TaxID=941183 RepID=UPI0037CADE04